MRRNVISITALLVAFAAAGCGSDFKDSRDSASGAAATTQATTTDTTTDSAPATGGKVSSDLTKKPAIPKPSGSPPTKLQVEDIVKGKGPAAKKGDKVTVQYVGVSWSTGEQFDASWDNGQPFSFTLGQGAVIDGWDQGVAGMRAGGRRKLTIPADLAYGATGSPPAIGPNETLVFVVDLEKIG
jgi:FKBP-type peptidyl-prolyl cis-trans isomerase